MNGPNDATDPDPDVLSEAEIAACLGALSGTSPTGVRNRALLSLLFSSGLRLGEALLLVPADVDLKAGTVRLGDGRRARVFGSALEFMEAWQLVRARRRILESARYFCTLNEGPLKDAYVRAMFGRTAKRARIGKRLHAFGLRRSFSVHAFKSGMPLEELQEQLGHSSSQATFAYLADASAVLANASVRAMPFDLATAPPAAAPAPPPAAPAPPQKLAAEEPPAALPAPPEPDRGASHLGADVRIVRPITLEEL